MDGRVRREAAGGLHELALAGDRAAGYARVVPGDRDVDEALEEVALVRLGGTPGLLERLVRREVLLRGDQRETLLEGRID